MSIVYNTFSEKDSLDLYLCGPPTTYGTWIYYYSKKQVTRNVCYELTWISGDSGFAFGFSSEKGQFVSFSPNLGYNTLLYKDIINNKEFQRVDGVFNIEKEIPILVCISIRNQSFTIIQNEREFISSFPSSFKPQIVKVHLFPGSSSSKIDHISVNCGNSPFSYPLPTGYFPFFHSNRCFTPNNQRIPIISHYLYIILLFK